MKDLLTGIAAALTACAAVFTLVFEQVFTDTTELQKKIKTEKGTGAGTAKELAQTKRRRQKLGSLGVVLVVAFVLSVVAIFVSNDSASTCSRACSQTPPTTTH